MPLSGILVDQLGAGLAGITLCLWPQLMASAREHLVPWIDRNAPELATPVRLAFHDLDVVADDLRHAVSGAWRRLRTLLIGQTVQFVASGNGEWAARITSYLRSPTLGDTTVIELITEEELYWEVLSEDTFTSGLERFSGTPVDIVKIRDSLLSAAV